MPKTKHFRILCALALFTAFATPARAELVVINASDYPLGTDLSAMFPSLTISRLTQAGGSTSFDPIVSTVYTVIDYPVPINSLGATYGLYAYQNCSSATGSAYSCTAGYNVLDFSFDTPVDFFQIDGYFYTDESHIIAYDVNGDVIADIGAGDRTYADGLGGTTRSTLTLIRDQPDIVRIVYGDLNGNSVTPTLVTYSVPEPTTLALVGLGLAGAGLRRAHRRRSARV